MPTQPQRFAPGQGIEIDSEQRLALTEKTGQLKKTIDDLDVQLKPTDLRRFIPDVQIYYCAVHYALVHDIFFEENEIEIAQRLIAQGRERAEQLALGNAPWTKATGLVVRGYPSDLDGTIQPYGLTVPESFDLSSTKKHRLDVWHHGRGAKLSELRFIETQASKPGEFTPDDTFMLHTYGRWSNAMKFAGEVDTFEALAHAKENYPVDEDRICVRGFSMGGAATWHQAVHRTDTWVAASPGAGFAETAVYQDIFSRTPHPPLWEQKLWNLYDATAYAGNLHQCPTVAYSGEVDKQMQAASIMAEYMAKEGLELTHIIGPGMGHKFHPDAKVEIGSRLEKIVAKGRNRSPDKIRFTTYTLRYNHMHWVCIDGLEKHWERAQIDADVIDKLTLHIKTQNIRAFSIDTDRCPVDPGTEGKVSIDGQPLPFAKNYLKTNGDWVVGERDDAILWKKHGLQGPIDDAFMESFVIVSPSGTPIANPGATDWISNAQADAIYQWEMQFRGYPRVKSDTEVTDEDILTHNLAIWGDPGSNRLFKKIADALPIQWDNSNIQVGSKAFGADKHVPIFIFPNPLNPQRYIVINSGFTFSANGAQSNATQTPKLPDWAILDTRLAADDPDRVKAADFFDEQWGLI
jgi:dienelactone hydrolase